MPTEEELRDELAGMDSQQVMNRCFSHFEPGKKRSNCGRNRYDATEKIVNVELGRIIQSTADEMTDAATQSVKQRLDKLTTIVQQLVQNKVEEKKGSCLYRPRETLRNGITSVMQKRNTLSSVVYDKEKKPEEPKKPKTEEELYKEAAENARKTAEKLEKKAANSKQKKELLDSIEKLETQITEQKIQNDPKEAAKAMQALKESLQKGDMTEEALTKAQEQLDTFKQAIDQQGSRSESSKLLGLIRELRHGQ